MQDSIYHMTLKFHLPVIHDFRIKTSRLENATFLWMSVHNVAKCVKVICIFN